MLIEIFAGIGIFIIACAACMGVSALCGHIMDGGGGEWFIGAWIISSLAFAAVVVMHVLSIIQK